MKDRSFAFKVQLFTAQNCRAGVKEKEDGEDDENDGWDPKVSIDVGQVDDCYNSQDRPF